MGYIKRFFSDNKPFYEWDGIHTPAVTSNSAYVERILRDTLADAQDQSSLYELENSRLINVLERIADALEEIAY